MIRHTAWSKNDVEILKQGVKYKIPYKKMAKILGRSSTSLNKAASRFGIREMYKRRYEKVMDINLKTINEKKEQPVVVLFNDVTKFLQKAGYSVSEKQIPVGKDCFVKQYFFNRQPISQTRLLLIANTIRLDLNQPIFVV
ncbi:MAG: hypothetical protein LBS83_01565 [Holosporales bacterium]|jgi:hypothetical protein|nr:hypothetical protein [Holosporales bacterium]